MLDSHSKQKTSVHFSSFLFHATKIGNKRQKILYFRPETAVLLEYQNAKKNTESEMIDSAPFFIEGKLRLGCLFFIFSRKFEAALFLNCS